MKIADIQALLTPARLDAVVAEWNAPGAAVRFIRAVENYIYQFERAGQPLILRFTHSSHRTTEQVAAELEFVDFMGRHAVSVARAVPSRHGRLTEKLAVDGSYFTASVFEMAPGGKATFDLPATDQTNLFRDWGALLGSMHRWVPQYRDGKGDPRRHVGINDDLLRNAASYLPPDLHFMLPRLEGLLAEIRKFPQTSQDYGLLHTDCHHGNFHVEGRRLTLFDFDDCCHHWIAFDLTVPVWHFPVKDRGQDPARDRAVVTAFFQEFIRGYQRENPFQRHWLDQMRRFLRLRDFQLFLFAHKTWDPDSQPWQRVFQRERGAVIEAGQPSVDLNWDALTL